MSVTLLCPAGARSAHPTIRAAGALRCLGRFGPVTVSPTRRPRAVRSVHGRGCPSLGRSPGPGQLGLGALAEAEEEGRNRARAQGSQFL